MRVGACLTGNIDMADNMENALIRYLFEGKTQVEIEAIFKEQGIKPNSLSSIEKTLQRLKMKHKAGTMFHLGAIMAIKKYITK